MHLLRELAQCFFKISIPLHTSVKLSTLANRLLQLMLVRYWRLLKQCAGGDNISLVVASLFTLITKAYALCCIRQSKPQSNTYGLLSFSGLNLRFFTNWGITTGWQMHSLVFIRILRHNFPLWLYLNLFQHYGGGALLQAYKDDPSIQSLLEAIPSNPDAHPGYSIRTNIILYHGRVLVPDNSALRQLLIFEYHNTPVGGHAGIQHTLHRINSTFTWPSLKKHVRDFVNSCNNCQFVKPFNRAPQGLLQPLPIPGQVWDSVSMDFITHLPPSSGKTVILVVVDHLSKQAHFSALCTKFIAVQVADIFTRDAIRLHGVLIVSHFWQELFRLQGTQLSISSAYHPQTDGHTKILNRYLRGLFALLRG